MPQRAVIAAHREPAGERVRQDNRLGDLVRPKAAGRQAQGLVVDVFVDIALGDEEIVDFVCPPDRPMMAVEGHLRAPAEDAAGFFYPCRPGQRVTHLRASQGVEIVQIARDKLGTAPGPKIREEHRQLGRGFGVRRVLELHPDAIDLQHLAGVVDDDIGLSDGVAAQRGMLAKAGTDMPARGTRQMRAVHIACTPGHHDPGHDILADGLFEKAGRRDDGHRTVSQRALDRLDTTEMVDMAVREDDGGYRPGPEFALDERQRRLCRFDRCQRIDDDPSGLTLDNRHVGQIVAADLVDARNDLVEAMFGIQTGLPPQAGMNRVRRVFPVEEVIVGGSPDRTPVSIADIQVGVACDKTALHQRPVFIINQGGIARDLRVQTAGHTGCRESPVRIGLVC